MKSKILKAAGMAFLLVGVSGLLMATGYDYNYNRDRNWNFCAPEIDAASASTALALLSGAVLMIRSRKKKN
jgi:hypothetical protein